MKKLTEADGTMITNTFYAVGLRRILNKAGTVSTFVWNGSDYLMEY